MGAKSGGFGWLWIVGLLAILVLFKLIGMGTQSAAVEEVAPADEPNPFAKYAEPEPNPFAEFALDPARTIPQEELDRVNAELARERQAREDARAITDELRRR